MAWFRAASLEWGRMRKCARPPTRGKRHGTTRSVRWLDEGGRVDPTTSPRRGNNVRPKLFLGERERLLAKPLGPERRVPELQLAIVAVRGGKRAELCELALGRGPRLDGEHLRELVDRVDAVLVAACNGIGECMLFYGSSFRDSSEIFTSRFVVMVSSRAVATSKQNTSGFEMRSFRNFVVDINYTRRPSRRTSAPSCSRARGRRRSRSRAARPSRGAARGCARRRARCRPRRRWRA